MIVKYGFDAISEENERNALQAIDLYITFIKSTPPSPELNERHIFVLTKLASVLSHALSIKNVDVNTIQKLVGTQALAVATFALVSQATQRDFLTNAALPPHHVAPFPPLVRN